MWNRTAMITSTTPTSQPCTEVIKTWRRARVAICGRDEPGRSLYITIDPGEHGLKNKLVTQWEAGTVMSIAAGDAH
jgi:hypothetical protein